MATRRRARYFDVHVNFVVLTRRSLRTAVLLTGVVVMAAQNDAGYALLDRTAAAARVAEPEWQFIPGVMNVPKLLDEQLGVAGGVWRRTGEHGEDAHVGDMLFRVTTEQAIARWPAPWRREKA